MSLVDADFWRRKRVLITGHTGFKGAWLSVWLNSLGAQVTGIALPPHTVPSLYCEAGVDSLCQSIVCDIRNADDLRHLVARARPEIVFHLAAQSLVRASYREPRITFETNVMGTTNLLEAMRHCGNILVAIIITTDKVYSNRQDGRAFQEGDPLGSHDPYSTSKAAAEFVVRCWAQSFFASPRVPVVTARAGNVIGGGDWSEDRLVPDIWRADKVNQQLVLRYPAATRPWQHVIEPLSGYLRYVEQISKLEDYPESLNFGPRADDILTVAQLAEDVHAAWGMKTGWRYERSDAGAEMQTLALDSTLAERTIGWKPRLDSRGAIAWTAEWYQRHADGEHALDLCLEQISRYEAIG